MPASGNHISFYDCRMDNQTMFPIRLLCSFAVYQRTMKIRAGRVLHRTVSTVLRWQVFS
jgi:hypothetical protein